MLSHTKDPISQPSHSSSPPSQEYPKKNMHLPSFCKNNACDEISNISTKSLYSMSNDLAYSVLPHGYYANVKSTQILTQYPQYAPKSINIPLNIPSHDHLLSTDTTNIQLLISYLENISMKPLTTQ